MKISIARWQPTLPLSLEAYSTPTKGRVIKCFCYDNELKGWYHNYLQDFGGKNRLNNLKRAENNQPSVGEGY